jgi:hypothetical protein
MWYRLLGAPLKFSSLLGFGAQVVSLAMWVGLFTGTSSHRRSERRKARSAREHIAQQERNDAVWRVVDGNER